MSSYFPNTTLQLAEGNNELIDATYAGMAANQDSYASQGAYQQSNADLNCFFPRTGLTPLGTPGTGLFGGSHILSNYPWSDDQQQMLNVSDYLMPQNFAPQQNQSQMAIAPSAIDKATNDNSTTDDQTLSNSANSNDHSEPMKFQKPKRGRPRKKRDKKKLSLEEENSKRRRFLERNRLAASKCRERKKNWTQETMDKLSREERTQIELQLEYNRLHGEVASLMEAACEHLGNCGDRSASFRESLSMASDRIADIGRVYLRMGGRHGGKEQEDIQDEEDSNIVNSEEPSPKRARVRRGQEPSSSDGIYSAKDSTDTTVVRTHQRRQHLNEQDSGQAQNICISRRSSENSSGSSEDKDSVISVCNSPIKSSFQLSTNEGFYGSDNSKPIISTSYYHNLPEIMTDTGVEHQDTHTELDNILLSPNFAM